MTVRDMSFGSSALLILAALAVYLVGNNTVALWDRDEPRYAQCSRQMLQTGDWVVPRLYDKVRTAKPPLIYWLQASCMKLMDDTPFAARLPSALGMTVSLLLVAAAVHRGFGVAYAFWATLILATTVMTTLSAKMCLTDAVLLLFITAAQVCLYRIYRGRDGWGTWIVMGLAIGLAGLTKGPVVLGIMGMTVVGLGVLRLIDRKWPPTVKADGEPEKEPLSNGGVDEGINPADAVEPSGPTIIAYSTPPRPTRPPRAPGPTLARAAVCTLVVAAVVAPWLILVERAHPGFLTRAIGHEVINRSREGLEGHKGPPGYYVAAIWPILLPWSLLLPMTLLFAWRRRAAPAIRFCLAAVLGPWLMFEIVQTKLPHYLLPCFPPLAFMMADVIVRALRGEHDGFLTRGFRRGVIIWGAAIIVAGFIPWGAAFFWPIPWVATALVSLFTIVLATVVCRMFAAGRIQSALMGMAGGMLAAMVLMFGVYLPQARYLHMSIHVANALIDRGVTQPGQAIMLDYREPSLAFYQGGTIREHSGKVITNKLLDKSPDWLVITRDVWNAKNSEQAARDRLEVVATFKGLNLADGIRPVEVMIVRTK